VYHQQPPPLSPSLDAAMSVLSSPPPSRIPDAFPTVSTSQKHHICPLSRDKPRHTPSTPIRLLPVSVATSTPIHSLFPSHISVLPPDIFLDLHFPYLKSLAPHPHPTIIQILHGALIAPRGLSAAALRTYTPAFPPCPFASPTHTHSFVPHLSSSSSIPTSLHHQPGA